MQDSNEQERLDSSLIGHVINEPDPGRRGENIQNDGASRDSSAEFESMRSSFIEGVRQVMVELERSSDRWDESSIPGMERVLVSLLDDGLCVATPFELSEQIRSAIRQNGVDWNFESFNQVGGAGFVGEVWKLMKESERT